MYYYLICWSKYLLLYLLSLFSCIYCFLVGCYIFHFLIFIIFWEDWFLTYHAFLQFDAKISLVTSFRDTCYIEILPNDKNPTRGKYYNQIPFQIVMFIFSYTFLSSSHINIISCVVYGTAAMFIGRMLSALFSPHTTMYRSFKKTKKI